MSAFPSPAGAAADLPRVPAPVAVPASRPAQPAMRVSAGADVSLGGLASQYGKYVALFVGAGLISGSVVHFPLAPARYAAIGAAGAALFAVASVLSDREGRSAAGLVRLALASLVLALGIGMISGSIQHFQDIPDRAARLIPLGLALSVGAFIVRNELWPTKDDLAAVALWTVTLVVGLSMGLGQLASTVGTGTGGHGHGGGEKRGVASKSSRAKAERGSSRQGAGKDVKAGSARAADGHGDAH